MEPGERRHGVPRAGRSCVASKRAAAGRRGGRTLVALAIVVALAPTARAAGPLGAEGTPLTTSSYGIDLFRGPLLTGNRSLALSGAVVALGEETDDAAVNPAATAFRVPWSDRPFDFALSLGISFPSAFADTDFDNDGEAGFVARDFVFLTFGLTLQMGDWGVAIVYDLQSYALAELERPGIAVTTPELDALVHQAHLSLSHAFLDGQLMVGLGFRLAGLGLEDTSGEDDGELFSTVGLAPELGVLWAPHDLPLRVGFAARLGVSTEVAPDSDVEPDAAGDLRVDGFYLPRRVALPWELEVGVAVQLGPRPLSPAWTGPEQARALRREKVLLLASLLVSGAVDDAIGTEAFQRQRVDRSGESVSFTPRVGVEVEPILDRLQVRAGSYLEPSRFRGGSVRPHGTFGVNLKVFSWSVFGLFDDDTEWRVSAAIDGARDYFNWSLSVGVWR